MSREDEEYMAIFCAATSRVGTLPKERIHEMLQDCPNFYPREFMLVHRFMRGTE